MGEVWPLQILSFKFKEREDHTFDPLDSFQSIVHIHDYFEKVCGDLLVIRLRDNLLLLDARLASLFVTQDEL